MVTSVDAYERSTKAPLRGYRSMLAAAVLAMATLAPPGAIAEAPGAATPVNEALLRGDIPAELAMAAPAPLDILFALVHSVVFDHPGPDDPRWATLYQEVRKRDKAYYASLAGEPLADDDARLPVFAQEAGDYTPDLHPLLQKWAVAYRAGLPEVVESEMHYSRSELREDGEGTHYVFAPLQYKASALADYADVLDSLHIPKEQAGISCFCPLNRSAWWFTTMARR